MKKKKEYYNKHFQYNSDFSMSLKHISQRFEIEYPININYLAVIIIW